MTIKRFIAGAVCPRCSNMDTIRAWRDNSLAKQYRECIGCGYTDEQSTLVQSQPIEIPTRVNQPYSASPEVDETVIHFMPNPKPSKH